MESRGHCDRRQVRRAVAASSHVINLRQGGDLLEVREASAVNHGHAKVVDELFGDEDVRVPDGVEDLADGQRRGRVLANDAEAFLQFCRDCIFEPEEVIGLEALSEARGFDGSEAVVNVVEQVKIVAEFQAQRFEQFGNMKEIFFGRPDIFRRQTFLGGLVVHLVAGDSVGRGQTGDTRLRAHCEVAHLFILCDLVSSFFDVATVGVTIDQNSRPALAAKQVVDGSLQGFAFDVPEGHVDGGDGGHGDGAAAPVGSAVEILPDVFDLKRIAADEAGDQVVRQDTMRRLARGR